MPEAVLVFGCGIMGAMLSAIYYRDIIAGACQNEREACARVAEAHRREWQSHFEQGEHTASREIAAAIRARKDDHVAGVSKMAPTSPP